MDLRHRIFIPALAAGLLAAAPVAHAAPARTGNLSASSATYAWDGAPVTGALVLGTSDETLLKIDTAGKLTVTIGEFSNPEISDLDVDIYKSNAAGEALGDPVKSGAEAGEERVALDVQTGFYLVQAYAFTGLEATYKGKATLAASGAAPVTPPVTPPGTTPAADLLPDAKLGTMPKAKAGKKLVLKGTAKDDKGVKSVGVAFVKKSGSKCTQRTASGKFTALAKCDAPTAFTKAKGTTKWSLTLKKGLAKGSYTVFARATDTAGQNQGGYGPSSRKKLTVK